MCYFRSLYRIIGLLFLRAQSLHVEGFWEIKLNVGRKLNENIQPALLSKQVASLKWMNCNVREEREAVLVTSEIIIHLVFDGKTFVKYIMH